MTVYYGSAVAVCWQSVGQVWTVRLPADGPHRLSTVHTLSVCCQMEVVSKVCTSLCATLACAVVGPSA